MSNNSTTLPIRPDENNAPNLSAHAIHSTAYSSFQSNARLRGSAATQPPSHRKLRLALYSNGDYAVQSESNAELPRNFDYGKRAQVRNRDFDIFGQNLNWRPALSGFWGVSLLSLNPWIALLCHRLIVARIGPNDPPTTVMQAVVATAFARITLLLIRQCFRNATYEICEEKSRLQRRKWLLRSYQGVAFLLLAPLISLPVVPTYAFSKVPTKTTVYRFPDRYWKYDRPGRMSFLSGTYPIRLRTNRTRLIDQFLPQPQSLEPWENAPDTFPQPPMANKSGISFNPSIPFWEPIWGAGHVGGIMLPVAIDNVERPSGKLFVPTDSFSGTFDNNGLSPSVECTKQILGNDWPHLLLAGDRGKAFDLSMTDPSNSCRGSVRMFGMVLTSSEIGEIYDLYDAHESWLKDMIVRTGSLGKGYYNYYYAYERFRKYRNRIEALPPGNLTLFAPTWTNAVRVEGKPVDSGVNCNELFLIAAPSDSVSDVNGRFDDNIQAAMCKLKLNPCTMKTGFTATATEFILSSANHSFKQSFPFSAVRWHQREPISSLSSYPFEDGIMSDLYRAINHLIPKIEKQNSHFIQLMLKYQVAAGHHSDDHYSIIYTSDYLVSRIIGQLSNAMASIGEETNAARVRPVDFSSHLLVPRSYVAQKTWWFWALEITLCIILSILGCVVLFNTGMFNYVSGLPWDVSTIAARANLLRNSNVAKIFRERSYNADHIWALQPLRIGLWKDNDNTQTMMWKFDTVLEFPFDAIENLKYSSRTWVRYNRRSLPRWMQCDAVLLGIAVFSILFWIIWGTTRARSDHLTRVEYSVNNRHEKLIPWLVSGQVYVPEAFGVVLWFRYIPLMVAFSLSFWWWEALYDFYKARQPWAELYRPVPSRKSITLDYNHVWVPVIKALWNRHYIVAVLALGSILNPILPLAVSNFGLTIWSKSPFKALNVPRPGWSLSVNKAYDRPDMERALRKSLQSMANSAHLPLWASHSQALLPVELASGPSELGYNSGLWELETETVRAQLRCQKLAHEVHRENHIFDVFKRGYTVTGIRIEAPEGLEFPNASTTTTLSPCDHNGYPASSKSGWNYAKEVTFCGKWQFIPLQYVESGKLTPRWIIAAYSGQTHLFEPGSSPLFHEETDTSGFWRKNKAAAIICEPEIYHGTGKAYLESLGQDMKLSDAVVSRFELYNESLLETDLGSTYSALLLNISEDLSHWGSQNDLWSKSPISTGFFMGDFLSFMIKRWSSAHRSVLVNDMDSLEEYANLVFATTFSVAVGDSKSLLSHSGHSMAIIYPVQYFQHLVLHRGVCIFLLVVYILYLDAMLTYGLWISFRKRYLFPIDPEPFANSLYFLYKSSLVSKLSKIRNPQKLSWAQFHHEVDKLRLICFFGRPSTDDSFTEVRVDVQEELETPDRDPPARKKLRKSRFIWRWRKRSPSNSSSSSTPESSSSSSTGTASGHSDSDSEHERRCSGTRERTRDEGTKKQITSKGKDRDTKPGDASKNPKNRRSNADESSDEPAKAESSRETSSKAESLTTAESEQSSDGNTSTEAGNGSESNSKGKARAQSDSDSQPRRRGRPQSQQTEREEQNSDEDDEQSELEAIKRRKDRVKRREHRKQEKKKRKKKSKSRGKSASKPPHDSNRVDGSDSAATSSKHAPGSSGNSIADPSYNNDPSEPLIEGSPLDQLWSRLPSVLNLSDPKSLLSKSTSASISKLLTLPSVRHLPDPGLLLAQAMPASIARLLALPNVQTLPDPDSRQGAQVGESVTPQKRKRRPKKRHPKKPSIQDPPNALTDFEPDNTLPSASRDSFSEQESDEDSTESATLPSQDLDQLSIHSHNPGTEALSRQIYFGLPRLLAPNLFGHIYGMVSAWRAPFRRRIQLGMEDNDDVLRASQTSSRKPLRAMNSGAAQEDLLELAFMGDPRWETDYDEDAPPMPGDE